MKRFAKAIKCSVAFVLCAALLAGCGSAASNNVASTASGTDSSATANDDFKITLKLSHVFQPDEQIYKSMELIGKRITEKTNGHVTVEVFGQGQLAVYEDALEQVVRGANFISVEEPSYLGAYVPDFSALVGPCLYQSYDEWEAMGETDLVKDLTAKAEEKGIHILSLNYEFGFRSLCTNKEIRNPEDLKGTKLRSTKSPLFINTINAMGGVATPMSFTECISAIQSGVVEGFEGSESTLQDTGAWEVVKKVALTRHFIAVRGVYINSDIYNSIPEEYRKIIDEEFEYGAKECRAAVEASHDSTVEKLKSEGVVFNDVDAEAFAKACKPVYDDLVKNSGCTEGIYETLLSELAKIRKA
ncbi:TRAP transporter substrate-binding protein DctP [Oscillospiraceae bacterium LTW-04]|nr:C4-dicarboxylate TRAP transporter substrate-binding protein [Oscillospiraceae bacterium MB24-C1]